MMSDFNSGTRAGFLGVNKLMATSKISCKSGHIFILNAGFLSYASVLKKYIFNQIVHIWHVVHDL